MSVKENLKYIEEKIKNKPVKIIAVSKTKPAEMVLEVYNLGHKQFGENKVQELVEKNEVLPKDIEWHMIGHLQRNKVKYIAPFIALIHSVDSFKLLKEIDKEGQKNNRVINCLLQVHIAEEETKFGLSAEELFDLIQTDDYLSLKNIKIKGLMGMATNTDDEGQIRKEFSSLKELFERLKSSSPPNMEMSELSMGMSGDYEIAMEEGSTMIRVGSSIFGERNYNH
jgi:PLP dependent protein